MTVVEWRGVSKRYGERIALCDFSLVVNGGERIALWGPSGCGKTTALRLLAGFDAPDTGSVLIDDRVVSASSRIVTAPEDRDLGMVFQDVALWPHMTVAEHLEFGLRSRRVPRSERGPRIRSMLSSTGLAAERNARPEHLSGGQQQRVALARALVAHPKALLLDEPLSNLDPAARTSLRKVILEAQQHLGFTLVLVTHDRQEAAELATRIVAMQPVARRS